MLPVRRLIEAWWGRLTTWWEHDEHMARHAMREWLRQQADLHPAERGEHWRES